MQPILHTFVLAVGGSFNRIVSLSFRPLTVTAVHCMHVEMLELGRKYLTQLFPNATFVGFLAPAVSSHVRKKCGKDQAIKKKHRLAMINIVTGETDGWIQNVSQCYGSALHCCDVYLRQLQAGGATTNQQHVYSVEVVGGDRAKPTRKSQGSRLCIIISRKGHDNKRSTFYQRNMTPKRKGLFAGMEAPADNVFLDGNDIFIQLDVNDNDVSSTKIRAALTKLHTYDNINSKRHILDELVNVHCISAAVASYILENEEDLYEG